MIRRVHLCVMLVLSGYTGVLYPMKTLGELAAQAVVSDKECALKELLSPEFQERIYGNAST